MMMMAGENILLRRLRKSEKEIGSGNV